MRPDGKIENLPKWAQAEIKRLRANIDYLHAELAAGPENSTAIADPYGDAPRPLGDSMVSFGLPGERVARFLVQLTKDGSLDVNSSSSSVQIQPRASNSFHVRHGDYF